jgi:hypothetical protein
LVFVGTFQKGRSTDVSPIPGAINEQLPNLVAEFLQLSSLAL